MNEVNAIRNKLNKNADPVQVRLVIADLIAACLRQCPKPLGYWEKHHFDKAIKALFRNSVSPHQPTSAWLRLCLASMERARVPGKHVQHLTAEKRTRLDRLTFKQLCESLDKVRWGA